MDNEVEIWKDIPNYEGLYQVSNLGRIKSLPRIVQNSMIKFCTKEKILKGSLKNKFYLAVGLCKNGNLKLHSVHKLVAICFLGHIPCGYKEVINHIDENPLNNKLSNLEITTQRKNTVYSKDKSKTSSKYIGVNWIEKNKKWQAYISIKEKRTHLGVFDNEVDAAMAYTKALDMYNNNDMSFIKHKKSKTSKYKGVSWHKINKLWVAQIQIDGIKKCLGYYKKEEDAALTYNEYVNKKISLCN